LLRDSEGSGCHSLFRPCRPQTAWMSNGWMPPPRDLMLGEIGVGLRTPPLPASQGKPRIPRGNLARVLRTRALMDWSPPHNPKPALPRPRPCPMTCTRCASTTPWLLASRRTGTSCASWAAPQLPRPKPSHPVPRHLCSNPLSTRSSPCCPGRTLARQARLPFQPEWF
jgi:hypothetical protein